MNQPLLQIDELTVDYRTEDGVVSAVRQATIALQPGETVALVGESGSGKSTTAQAVVGLLPAAAELSGGRVLFEGQEMLGLPPRLRRQIAGARIGYVPQDPMAALNPVQKIGRQIAEVLRVHRITDRRQAAMEAVDALELAGVDRPSLRAQQYPHQLSGGMRQRALIAMALIAKPALVVADEPTSALDVTVQRKILDRIGALTTELGAGVLLITHDLAVAAERADRIVVMQRGEIVETGAAAEVLGAPRADYTRELISAAPSLASRRLTTTARRNGPAAQRPAEKILLRADQLVKDFALPRTARSEVVRAADRVSFEVRTGETFALVGESGSGKSTTARLAIRLERPDAGTVSFDGEDITGVRGERLRQLRRRFQLVHQSPFASLDPRIRVGAQIAAPLAAFGIGSRTSREQRVAALLDRVGLSAEHADRLPVALSGGQRQRVAIARALALQPELVVLDEPVSALDVSVQAMILQLLVDLQDELEVAYLFISHDLAVVRQIAHRVAVLRHGKVVETGGVQQVFDRPRHDYTRELLAAIPSPLSALEGTRS